MLEKHTRSVESSTNIPPVSANMYDRVDYIFSLFKCGEKILYGGHEIDYTEHPVALSVMLMITEPKDYKEGSMALLESILSQSKVIVSAAAGSGRMDIIFNEWIIALGNKDYKYKGFDIAPQPQKTRLNEWIGNNHPHMTNRVSMVFNSDFYDTTNYRIEGSSPDLVIIHNALDVFFDKNKFTTFGPEFFELLPPDAHVFITMGGTHHEYIDCFQALGFRVVIKVSSVTSYSSNLKTFENTPLIVLQKPA